jgi:hypothetical protein
MSTLAFNAYLDSEFNVPTELEGAGTALENPYVYDSVARELKTMAERGLVKITRERLIQAQSGQLISKISFARLR